MEGAIGFLLVLIFLTIWIVLAGLAYKNRARIQRWLNTPYYASEDRRLQLSRKIEDAKKELEELDKAETGG